VTIYSDWGWYTGWYASFGYYPLYCDAPYYYWDRWYYRPYYYAYYPIYYGWPSCGVYVRPYPVYAWRTHPVYNGDYLVRYQRGQTHTPPLYDASPARDRSKEGDRGYTRTPPSISTRTNGNGRVNQELLVRDTAPVRSVDTRDLGDARDRTATSRVGVRTGEARPTRTVRSLQSENTARQVQPGAERVTDAGQSRSGVSAPSNSGRRWTRPVVRNERDPNAQTPSAGRVSRDTAAGRSDGGSRVSPPVDRSSEGARPAREVRSGAVQQRGDTGASTTRRDTRSVRQNNSSSTPERRTVQPRKSTSSSSGGGRQATSASRGSSRQEAAPQQRVSPPPRSGAKSGGSGGSGASPSRQSPPRSQASGRGGSRGGSSAGSRSGGGRG
jgi:hypothetical protein